MLQGERYIYIELLDIYQINIIKKIYNTNSKYYNNSDIVKGIRSIIEMNIKEIPLLENIIKSKISNVDIKPIIRIYSQICGNIKKHVDNNAFNSAKYTLLIYLNNFQGGELNLYYENGDIATIIPKIGNAVIFEKNLIHDTNNVYSEKEILIVDIDIDLELD